MRLAISFLAVFLLSTAAEAQSTPSSSPSPEELATRRQLIDEATRRSSAGDHQGALELALRAERIQSSTSLKSFIAARMNAVGRYTAAFSYADQCRLEALGTPTLRNREALLEECTRSMEFARNRAGQVLIRLPSDGPSGAVVRVNGNTLSEALLGVPYMVDPGDVLVEATVANRTPFRRTIRVESQRTETIEVQWTEASTQARNAADSLASVDRVTPNAPRASSDNSTLTTPRRTNSRRPPTITVDTTEPANEPRTEPGDSSGVRSVPVGAWVLIGVGGASAIAATVGAILYATGSSELYGANCPLEGESRVCPTALRGAYDRASLGGTMGWVAGPLSVLSLSVGIPWAVIGTPAERPSARRTVRWIAVVPQSAGWSGSVGGVW